MVQGYGIQKAGTKLYNCITNSVRQPGFAPGFPDWRSDVLDETGRLSLYRW
jgi:hypothetical protein